MTADSSSSVTTPAARVAANTAARAVGVAAAALYTGFIAFALISGAPSDGAPDPRRLTPPQDIPRGAVGDSATASADPLASLPRATTRPMPTPAEPSDTETSGPDRGAQLAEAQPTPTPTPTPTLKPRPAPSPAPESRVIASAEPATPTSAATRGDPGSMEGRLTAPLAPGAAAGEAGAAGVGQPGLAQPGVGAPSVNMEFVVQLTEAEGKRFRDLFIESPARARAAFQDYADTNPAFGGLSLKHVTYGGACTLVYDGAVPRAPQAQQELADSILGRLNSAASVEYAEPNLVAWRGSVTP